MPNACAIRLKDRWLIFPELKSSSGFFVASEPYQSLPTDAEAVLLGRAVRNAFEFAQRQIPDPTDWKAFSAPRLAAAGVKSEAAFQRNSQLVTITAVDSRITLTPTRNGGTKGADKGFHQLEDNVLVVAANCTDDVLGKALHETLSSCV